MIFQAEKKSFFSRQLQTLLVALEEIFLRVLWAHSFRCLARKDPDMRSSHDRGMADPLFEIGDLLAPLCTLRVGKDIPNRGPGNRDAAEISVPFELQQIVVIELRRKKVTRQFRSGTSVIGTVIDEVEEVPVSSCLRLRIWLSLHPLHLLAKRIGRQSQQEFRITLTFKRLNRTQVPGSKTGTTHC
ncbi:MAG: hypothetical protein ACJAVK_000148 [Akkermansiaceae bacterium]|jgi:hypothetical protein